MKFITIVDEKTKEVLVQLGEDELGGVYGMYSDNINVIVDGELISTDTPLKESSALDCSCGAKAKDLDVVRTLTSYIKNGNLSDVEIEYKVVCPKCGKEGDLAPNRNGAVLSWNESILKGKLQ